jgi:hypothetical protein
MKVLGFSSNDLEMKHFLFAHVFFLEHFNCSKKIYTILTICVQSEQLDQGECSIALTQILFSKSSASESLS